MYTYDFRSAKAGPDARALIKKIQRVLSPDLLKPEWRGNPNRLAGHCYTASEALFHMLGGKAAGAKPFSAPCPGGVHWWIEQNGVLLDPTGRQFDPETLKGIHANGRGRGFLTAKPSERAQKIVGHTSGQFLDAVNDFRSRLASRRYYHGTSSKFDAFDLNKAGARDYGDFGVGIYLTPSARLAAMYAHDAAKKTRGEPVIVQVRVKTNKLADFDDPQQQQLISDALGIPFPHKALQAGGKQTRPRNEAEAITKFVQTLGYDGGLGRGGQELVIYSAHYVSIEAVHPASEAGELF